MGGHQEVTTKERKTFKAEGILDRFRCYSEVK